MSKLLSRHAWTIHDRERELSSSKLVEFLNEYCADYVFQLEKGDEKGYAHWQGRLDFGRKDTDRKRCSTVINQLAKAFDIEKERVTVSPEVDSAASKFYCSDPDKTVLEGPFSKRPVYLGRDLACMASPLPWQQWVIDGIAKEADDRTINWIFDPVGCRGKTKLCKWLCWKGKAVRVGLGTAAQIKSSVVEGGAARAYLVDLPRSRGSDESMGAVFSAIEDIKNGWVESTMYGKKNVLFMDPPHVFVFSNHLPKTSLASIDRWRLWGWDAEGTFKALTL